MTFDFDTWARGSILPSSRAESVWRIISRDPRSIVFIRQDDDGGPAVELAAQTVRVEHDNSARTVQTGISTTSVQQVKVYGIRNHSTLPDTNIQAGDRFFLGLSEDADSPKSEYIVKELLLPPGQIQAIAERVSE